MNDEKSYIVTSFLHFYQIQLNWHTVQVVMLIYLLEQAVYWHSHFYVQVWRIEL